MLYVIGAFVVGGVLGVLVMALVIAGARADAQSYDRERG